MPECNGLPEPLLQRYAEAMYKVIRNNPTPVSRDMIGKGDILQDVKRNAGLLDHKRINFGDTDDAFTRVRHMQGIVVIGQTGRFPIYSYNNQEDEADMGLDLTDTEKRALKKKVGEALKYVVGASLEPLTQKEALQQAYELAEVDPNVLENEYEKNSHISSIFRTATTGENAITRNDEGLLIPAEQHLEDEKPKEDEEGEEEVATLQIQPEPVEEQKEESVTAVLSTEEFHVEISGDKMRVIPSKGGKIEIQLGSAQISFDTLDLTVIK